MQFKGKIWKFGDNVNTDEIISAKYLITSDQKELAKHCLETIHPQFSKRAKKNDIIVAGENFGCGSSREHAALALKGAGISCIIAKSFARIFFRNCINIGLPILEEKKLSESCSQGDILEINLTKGVVKNLSNKREFETGKFPSFLQEIISSGGLMKWVKKKVIK